MSGIAAPTTTVGVAARFRCKNGARRVPEFAILFSSPGVDAWAREKGRETEPMLAHCKPKNALSWQFIRDLKRPPMTNHSIPKAAALTGLLILAGWSSIASADESSAWIMRPIATGTTAGNVDVMTGPNGEVMVGYASMDQGDVTVARLPQSEKLFQRHTDPIGGSIASFAADKYGNVFYATKNLNTGMRVGQDLGGFGGLVSNVHPAADTMDRWTIPAIGVNASGLPVVVNQSNYGLRLYSTFNPIESQWQTGAFCVEGFSLGSSISPSYQSLAFDAHGNPVMACVQARDNAIVVARRDGSQLNWSNLAQDSALMKYGTTVATASNGEVGFAYVNGIGELNFNSYGDDLGTRQTISAQPSSLTSHSLAYDANGNPAIVYSQSSTSASANALHLARRNSQGQWTDEVLPVNSQFASLTFDAQNTPLVAAYTGAGITLLGKNIAGLRRGDFDLNDTVNSSDVGGLVQAVKHPAAYLTANPGMIDAELLLLGDYTNDASVNQRDARTFADSLAATPLPGLSTRKAGYVALDQADAAPSLGSGAGNFFNTTFATNKTYQAGDSRGDLAGIASVEADGRIDALDINYLVAHLNESDSRTDLNGDGLTNRSDVDTLVTNILGSLYGDANLDGTVDATDLNTVLSFYNQPVGSWTLGDFNGDSRVDATDLNTILSFYNRSGTSASLADIGFSATTPEPGTLSLLIAATVTALAGVWRRHRA